MKRIKIGKNYYSIPDEKIESSFAGACAAHQCIVHEEMFGKDQTNFSAYLVHFLPVKVSY